MPRSSRKVYAPSAPIPAQITSDSSPDELQRVLDVLTWRQSLDDMTVRSMAADYLRGETDACNTDAFQEYEHRFGRLTKNQRKAGKNKRALRPYRKRK